MTPADPRPSIAGSALQLLRAAGVRLEPGLTPDELAAIDRRFGFEFNPDHRGLLQLALPSGDGWPDWRDGDAEALRRRLDAPLHGLLFDVEHNGFWPAPWGSRPTDLDEALATARHRLATVPRLVPVYRARYAPAAPAPANSPVLSVMQSDVLYYGANLAGYVEQEFSSGPSERSGAAGRGHQVEFWSDLAESRW